MQGDAWELSGETCSGGAYEELQTRLLIKRNTVEMLDDQEEHQLSKHFVAEIERLPWR
jgi:hypothetical protein